MDDRIILNYFYSDLYSDESDEIQYKTATKAYSRQIIKFMSNESYISAKKVNPDGIEGVVNLALDQPGFGTFIIATDAYDDIKGVIMCSYEYSDYCDGCYFWVQFAEAEIEGILDGLIQELKDVTAKDRY